MQSLMPYQEAESRLALLLERPDAEMRLQQLARRARWAMSRVKNIGLDDQDLMISTLRTALRREREEMLSSDQTDDEIWNWVGDLLWKKYDDYRKRQIPQKHGWILEADVFPIDSTGMALVPDARQSDPGLVPASPENVEAYIARGFEAIGRLPAELRPVAELMAQQYKSDEIAQLLEKSIHAVRRLKRRIKAILSGEPLHE